MAVNKKVRQEGEGGGVEVVGGSGSPMGRRNLFSLAGRFIERLPDPHGSAFEMKSSVGGWRLPQPAGSRGQFARRSKLINAAAGAVECTATHEARPGYQSH